VKLERIQLFPVVASRDTGITNQHVIVRIEAENAAGWGEMSDLSHVPMYQFDIAELERTLNELLRGRDASNLVEVEDSLLRFFPDEGHMYSRSGLVRQGVDLALHDLVARHHGIPVHELLGGRLRDRIRVCYPIFRLRSPDQVERSLYRVQEKLNEGFNLIRFYVGANLEADERFLRAFGERFGGRVEIKSLDFSNLLDWRRAWSAAERFGEIARFMLLESVAPRNDLDGLAEFRRRSRWPISEHVQHLAHGWQLVQRGSVDILNLSPYLLGGLRASLRLVALAEAARAGVLIGTTQELNLGTAAVAQLGAVARVLDYPSDSTGPRLYTSDVVKSPVRYEAGHLMVPTGAGLGVEVDEDLLRERGSDARWTFGTDLAGVLDRTAPPGAGRDGSE